MQRKSDPARDFTDLCQRLRMLPTGPTGSDTLATYFGVAPWSTEFMLVLASIHQRIEALRGMIAETELDPDIVATAQGCLEGIRHAFIIHGLVNPWQNCLSNFLTDANLTPVLMTSGYVRVNHGYVVPSNEEVSLIIDDIENLIGWLETQQLNDKDFIRASLIEGLKIFLVRFSRVEDYGMSAAFDSLRAVVAAYMALERGLPDAGISPPYEAMVKKAGEVLRRTFDKLHTTKKVVDVGDWLLRGYGTLSLASHAHPTIAGLLAHTT